MQDTIACIDAKAMVRHGCVPMGCSFPEISYCLQALKGPIAVAMAVIRGEGGVLGLYKGTVSTLWREIPGNAAMFGTYEVVKQWMARQQVRPAPKFLEYCSNPTDIVAHAQGRMFWEWKMQLSVSERVNVARMLDLAVFDFLCNISTAGINTLQDFIVPGWLGCAIHSTD